MVVTKRAPRMLNIDQTKVIIPDTAIDCPHCRVKSHFTPERKIWYPKDHEVWVIQECDNCHKLTSMVYLQTGISNISGNIDIPHLEDEPVSVFPTLVPNYHVSILPEIGEDYVEALKCFSAGSFNSTAVMCRRALQTSLIEKGATRSKRLIDQIDELKGNVVGASLASWAHEIREVGNIGAHPDKYEPRGVTKETAKDMIDFLEDWLRSVYIRPWEIQERKQKRKAQTQNP